MKMLVTGGAGFIGSNFIHYWLKTHPGDQIVNLDALTYAANLENLDGIDCSRHVLIHGDIADPSVVKKAMDGVECVVNFAAESHVDRSIADSSLFIRTNVLGTQVLLEEARRRGTQIKRFHHVSTDEVFGSLELEGLEKFNEKTSYDPRSPYSASKASSDHLCRAYLHTHGVPVTISNCSNNYGPYQHPEKFIPNMISRAMQNQPLPVYGDGRNVRDWIYVEDHCKGIAAVLEGGTVGETYCLGGDAERANLAVAKMILVFMGKDESLITFVEDRKGHDLRYAIDSSKARRDLGWAPQVGFEEGLQKTIAWYLEHESLWKKSLAAKTASR